MHTLKIAVIVIWIVFGIYWFVSALSAKEGRGSRRRIPLNGLTALAVVLLLRFLGGGSLAIDSPVLGAVGVALCVAGLAVAVWARVDLGRNWGMPMTQKSEPELITSGPYRLIRHRAGDEPARVGHRRGDDRLLLLLRVGGGEEPHRDLPGRLSRLPVEDEDADPLRPLTGPISAKVVAASI
jgi:hypothetical protein